MDHNKKHHRPDTEQRPQPNQHRWSVHVWTTWVKRYPSEDESEDGADSLTEVQTAKLTHFFTHLFDSDRDSIITLQDFESFTERVRHFTDWTINSGEYLVLQQVQQGFVHAFLAPNKSEHTSDAMVVDLYKQFLSVEEWLKHWSRLLAGVKSLQEMPIWLQYLPKILFQAINKSGSGRISRDELSAFYSSVMGFTAQRVGQILDEAYKAMTASGDCTLTYAVYRLCFANFLLGRFPNGPGRYVFGMGDDPATPSVPFPIDYSAMNTAPEDIEQYSNQGSTNRRSIVV
ncbi:hypothetical protein AAG570_003288 [Ranatra chinensis]|uniref:Sarcoplasmic calcium-binding protein n=1 Tax=Ranatra chinensis TaxID=642074 RepID=A0ABD0Y7G0_9HEMI